jgi:glycine hydroxymethyltransferase
VPSYDMLKKADPDVYDLVVRELSRQREHLELIASENFTSLAVQEANGSVLTNKYAEGLPGKRYYGGCEFVDGVEQLAIDRLKQLFGCDHANVQPHSGAQANMAAFMAAGVKPGDTILGMDLSNGGHLTHGSPVNFSGLWYNVVSYSIDLDTGLIDMANVRQKALEAKPKLIICGASAYSRIIDFAAFRQIADEVGAVLMADIAHYAGLAAAGVYPNPFPHAHIVTSTTHKTLRGPRGGVVMCQQDLAKAVDKAVFPGLQGGPLEHVIAAKAVAFKEALSPEFKEYSVQVVRNAQALAKTLQERGIDLVSGGTDTHLMMLDLRKLGLTGKEADRMLSEINITANKNAVPNDPNPPLVTSGIRLGTPAVTTRGMKEADMADIGNIIADILTGSDSPASCKTRVLALTERFPLYPELALDAPCAI